MTTQVVENLSSPKDKWDLLTVVVEDVVDSRAIYGIYLNRKTTQLKRGKVHLLKTFYNKIFSEGSFKALSVIMEEAMAAIEKIEDGPQL